MNTTVAAASQTIGTFSGFGAASPVPAHAAQIDFAAVLGAAAPAEPISGQVQQTAWATPSGSGPDVSTLPPPLATQPGLAQGGRFAAAGLAAFRGPVAPKPAAQPPGSGSEPVIPYVGAGGGGIVEAGDAGVPRRTASASAGPGVKAPALSGAPGRTARSGAALPQTLPPGGTADGAVSTPTTPTSTGGTVPLQGTSAAPSPAQPVARPGIADSANTRLIGSAVTDARTRAAQPPALSAAAPPMPADGTPDTRSPLAARGDAAATQRGAATIFEPARGGEAPAALPGAIVSRNAGSQTAGPAQTTAQTDAGAARGGARTLYAETTGAVAPLREQLTGIEDRGGSATSQAQTGSDSADHAEESRDQAPMPDAARYTAPPTSAAGAPRSVAAPGTSQPSVLPAPQNDSSPRTAAAAPQNATRSAADGRPTAGVAGSGVGATSFDARTVTTAARSEARQPSVDVLSSWTPAAGAQPDVQHVSQAPGPAGTQSAVYPSMPAAARESGDGVSIPPPGMGSFASSPQGSRALPTAAPLTAQADPGPWAAPMSAAPAAVTAGGNSGASPPGGAPQPAAPVQPAGSPAGSAAITVVGASITASTAPVTITIKNAGAQPLRGDIAVQAADAPPSAIAASEGATAPASGTASGDAQPAANAGAGAFDTALGRVDGGAEPPGIDNFARGPVGTSAAPALPPGAAGASEAAAPAPPVQRQDAAHPGAIRETRAENDAAPLLETSSAAAAGYPGPVLFGAAAAPDAAAATAAPWSAAAVPGDSPESITRVGSPGGPTTRAAAAQVGLSTPLQTGWPGETARLTSPGADTATAPDAPPSGSAQAGSSPAVFAPSAGPSPAPHAGGLPDGRSVAGPAAVAGTPVQSAGGPASPANGPTGGAARRVDSGGERQTEPAHQAAAMPEAIATSQIASAAPQSRAGAPVTSSALPATIARMSADLPPGGSRSVVLRLDPASLGAVRISIETSGAGVAVRVVAAAHETCSLLLGAQSQLRTELGRHGLDLSSFSANVGSDGRQGGGAGGSARGAANDYGRGESQPDTVDNGPAAATAGAALDARA